MPVAFKLLKLGKLSADARASVVRQLKREGSLMWLLNGHPNTVQLYGAVAEGKRIGLAFELCNAGSLQEHLYTIETDEQSGHNFRPVTGASALTPTQQLGAVSSLLQAIGFAHAKGVVHRDLKSANVLVHDFHRAEQSRAAASQAASSQSSSSVLFSASASPALLSFKLSDFGSARAMGQFAGLSAFASSMSGAGQSGGALRWTPPELLSSQWHKISVTDQRALENSFAVDIYAIGLVIGEIYMQQPPFAQLGPQSKDAQLSNAIIDPTCAPFEWRAVEAVTPKLAHLIQACCHRNPHRRPTIAELTYKLWPETMQQLLAQAPSGVPAKPVVAVISPPSVVTLSDDARNARIRSAVDVLKLPSPDALTLEMACTTLAEQLVDSAGTVLDSSSAFVVQLGGVELALVRLMQLPLHGTSLFIAASAVMRQLVSNEAVALTLLRLEQFPSFLLVAAASKPLDVALIGNVCAILGRVLQAFFKTQPQDRDKMKSMAPRTAGMLLSALQDHSSNVSVLRVACGACAWLLLSGNMPEDTEVTLVDAVLLVASQNVDDAKIVKHACHALSNFANILDDDSTLRIVQRPAVLLTLQTAITRHNANPDVIERACSTLNDLLVPSTAHLLLKSGIVDCLASVSSAPPSIVATVLSALSFFARNEEIARHMVCDKNGDVFHRIVSLATLPANMQDLKVVGSFCDIVATLVLKGHARAMVEAGVVPHVVRGLQLHSKEWAVCASAVVALCSLAEDASGCTAVGLQHGAFELILDVLPDCAVRAYTLESVVRLLSNLSADFVHRTLLVRLNAVALLRALVSVNSDGELVSKIENLIALLQS